MDIETLEEIAGAPPEVVEGVVLDAGPDPQKVAEAEQMFGMVFGLLYVVPTIKAAYPPAQVKLIAVAYVPLAEKHGWQMGDLMARFGPEIGFAFALLPPVILEKLINRLVDMVTGTKDVTPPDGEKPEPAA